MIAEVAEWPDEIDVQRAQDAMDRAEKRLSDISNDTDVSRARTALSRSLARLYVAKK